MVCILLCQTYQAVSINLGELQCCLRKAPWPEVWHLRNVVAQAPQTSFAWSSRRGAVAAEQSVDFAQVIIDQGTPKPTWQDPGTLRAHLPGGAWLLLDGDATQTTLATQILKALQA